MAGTAHNPQEFDRKFLAGFAVLLTVLSFGYMFLVTFYPPASGSAAQHYADIILGFILGTAVASVVGFFYGASKQQTPPTFPQPTAATIKE